MPDAPAIAAHPLAGRRIVILLGSGGLGGAERQALHLAEHLMRSCGALVTCAGMGAPGAATDECRALGIPWISVGRVESSWVAISLAKMALVGLALRSLRAELLLSYTAPANVTAAIVHGISGARVAVWNQRDEGLGRAHRWLERLAVRRTTAYVANSAGGALHLERDLAVDPRQIEIIENGVALRAPLADRAAWRARLAAAEGQVVVGMVANLHRNKDHPTLLRAWRLVARRSAGDGMDVKLVLAGRFDEAYSALRQQCADLGITSSVVFLGPTDDVAGFLGAIDLAVFSSASEGCPNTVLEMMAAGLAVVATDIPAVRSILPASSLPRLAAVGDAEGLAERILTLIRSPSERLGLGADNRARAQERFALPKTLARMEDRLVRCLAGRR